MLTVRNSAREPRRARPARAYGSWVVILLLSASAVAQRVIVKRPVAPRAIAGIGGGVLDGKGDGKDSGPTVRMPVSLNIDRHLLKAQTFLQAERYASAFQVLQAVIEGRTLTEEDDEPREEPAPNDPAGGAAEAWDITSAKNAVFSDDDRLFHPVRRLCHEILASLPAEGISAYRTQFEIEAERRLAEATVAFDVNAIEEVFERHFVTLAAARALESAGDLRMDRGQFRAALQDFRLLLEVYPEAARAEAGVDDAFVRLKIALCFAQLGDPRAARAELGDLAKLSPGATMRVLGELTSVEELSDHELMRESEERPVPAASRAADRFVAPSELVPLWEFRFDEPRPYRVVRDKNRNRRNFIQMSDGSTAVSLNPSLFAPGTSVRFLPDRIAFLDHFRLRYHESLSGRMLLETGEPLREKLRPNKPRSRVASIDFSAARIASDGSRIFVTIGAAKPKSDVDRLLSNRIIAYDAISQQELWSSSGHAALAKVTFLASPTVFGSRLLAPVLDGGTISVQCVDAATGEPLYRVPVHRGGTVLARPLASPIAVDQGIAYVLSNAGAIAAIDAHTGSLRWTRRYERLHPLRPKPLHGSRRGRDNPFGFRVYTEVSKLPGFAPSEVVTAQGLVVFAPCDGNVLHCLDGASGEPVWMLNRTQRVPRTNHTARWRYVLGHDEEHLYLAGDHDVTCVALESGVRLWREELPSVSTVSQWRGRGAIAGNHILVPGTREILARSIAPDSQPAAWRRLPLPELSIGREPLDGPFNLQVHGVFLAACYEGGIEIYSTVESLLELADETDDPRRKSLLQAQAGDMLAAFSTLESVDATGFGEEQMRDYAQRLLSVSGELSIAMAAHGGRADALALLDRCRARLQGARDVQRWHLARIDVFQTLGDLDAVEAEQQALYALMEGN